MQYYFDGDDNLYDYTREKTFSIPAKTKQIGSIEPHVKIYMEDYVYTYLYQYGRSGGGTEKLAALIGRHSVVDGQEVIVISGAIQGKGSTQINGVECFTEDTWEYIGGQMQKYFEGMSVVGWVHCQPGFGSFLMSRDETFHKEYFKEKWQALFVLDSVDKLDAFYIYHPERKHLQPARGYFIYYDKNREMQEYMLENSLIRPREAAAELQKEQQKELQKEQQESGAEQGRRRRKPSQAERLDAAKEIRRVLQRREKVAKQAKKEHYATLAAVSAVLCVVCICMGFAMMSSLNRLRTLETELVAMQTSYEALAEGFEDVRVQSVFAVQQAEQVEQAMQEEQKKLIAQAEAAEKAKKAEREEKKAEKAQKTYCVESGDSLGYISTKFYGTSSGIKKIMEANSLKNADMIFEGQKLLIP